MAYRGLLAALILGFPRAMGEFGATVTVAGNIPGKTQTLTVMFYLKSIAKSLAPEAWGRMPMFRGDHFDTLPEAFTTLAILVTVSLALGSWILSRRQYVMSS